MKKYLEPVVTATSSFSRRAALSGMGIGLGSIALNALSARRAIGSPASSTNVLAPKPPHFAPRAKNVILLFASGGVSHLELFDPKPELVKNNGKMVPDELIKGQRFSFINPKSKLLGSPYSFSKHGDCGMEFGELLPNLARLADRTTLVRSVRTDNVNHTPAQVMMATGVERPGRPSMGAWVTYGLGSMNSDLPAFVDMYSGKSQSRSPLKPSGFLPSVHQAVTLRSGHDPVYYLSDPDGMKRDDREVTIRAINDLNRNRLAEVGDPEIATRIAQYEMAFRMQRTVPELVDLSTEPAHILKAYGVEPGKPSLAGNLLMSRRMIERGVRFVQLRDGGWDHHSKIFKELPEKCGELDQPLAALVEDLDERGLLDETLIIWAGEFGRTPMLQGSANKDAAGRDHHKEAFTVWMAGGGLKPGLTYGSTDELGFMVTENPVHVHDLHATILHLLGLDHERLVFPHGGLDHRLTDVHGKVVRGLLS
ncbi:DUF1501 domain-containing protein [Opitutales bacterium]|jgi:hypothetical protein|nr:DUF1501 domain-containing protein [Opitutales bacterium]